MTHATELLHRLRCSCCCAACSYLDIHQAGVGAHVCWQGARQLVGGDVHADDAGGQRGQGALDLVVGDVEVPAVVQQVRKGGDTLSVCLRQQQCLQDGHRSAHNIRPRRWLLQELLGKGGGRHASGEQRLLKP